MAGTARACRAGVPTQSPARGAPDPAPHSGAALIKYGQIRQPLALARSAVRYTAFLCCDLAALSPAAAARLYISSVLPLKISNRRRQSETHIRTPLPDGGGPHDLADIRCPRTMRRVLGYRCGTGRHQPSAVRAAARLFREARVLGWSGPRTRS